MSSKTKKKMVERKNDTHTKKAEAATTKGASPSVTASATALAATGVFKVLRTDSVNADEPTPAFSLGRWRCALTNKGISQRLLAQRLGVAESVLSSTVHGARTWAVGLLERAAKELGVKAGDLCEGVE